MEWPGKKQADAFFLLFFHSAKYITAAIKNGVYVNKKNFTFSSSSSSFFFGEEGGLLSVFCFPLLLFFL